MTVIEVDGIYVNPYKVQGVDLAIGQRYSVLVTMNGDPHTNYPMVAATDPTSSDNTATARPNTTAWLIYDPKAPILPPQTISSWYYFNDTDIHPLQKHTVNISSIKIELSVQFGSDGALINGVQYLPPDVPTLWTVLTSPDPANPSSYPASSNVYPLKYNESYWVIIENNTPVDHPCTSSWFSLTSVHIHGHTPEIVFRSPPSCKTNSSGPYCNYDPSKIGTYPYFDNAVQRDVVLVYSMMMSFWSTRMDSQLCNSHLIIRVCGFGLSNLFVR